jgi:flagellar hook protein FlgE
MVPLLYSWTLTGSYRGLRMTDESAPGTRKDRKMLGSLYSAVSGLQANQTKMNVIGNNIANVNTYGFKSSRVTFSDVFYQTLSASTASDSDTGGTNSSQLGYGTTVASVDVLNTQAGSASTGKALDVYINGEGYLAAKTDSGEIMYTRVGDMNFDASGNLVDANGNMILGLNLDSTTGKAQLDADGTTDTSNLTAIQIPAADLSKYSDISVDSTGVVSGTVDGDPTFTKGTGTGWMTTATLPTSSLYSGSVTMDIVRSDDCDFIANSTTIGSAVSVPATAGINGDITVTSATTSGTTKHSLTYTALGDTATTTVQGYDDGTNGDATSGDGIYTFAVPDNDDTTSTSVYVTANINSSGTNITIPSTNTLSLGNVVADTMDITLHTYNKAGDAVTLSATYDPTTSADTISIGDFTLTVDGTALGVLEDQTGTTIGSVGAGDSTVKTIGQIALCKFANASGLTEAGSGYYLKSANSGEAVATIPGDTGTGTLESGELEMSNVDLSAQFTDMITTQRGFQANARMITTSDSILEELVNLKRS